ncbi:hypothetical protein T05_3518 [Trichinella murrelli]|uniref:Uncharacterized protein n=1 Tax=Trichinella murrelli TaxID=144512 RepID=A0A0V0T964_9BILA|nr:hypothetical protein T05_3518 [Trichinella murrelli]
MNAPRAFFNDSPSLLSLSLCAVGSFCSWGKLEEIDFCPLERKNIGKMKDAEVEISPSKTAQCRGRVAALSRAALSAVAFVSTAASNNDNN